MKKIKIIFVFFFVFIFGFFQGYFLFFFLNKSLSSFLFFLFVDLFCLFTSVFIWYSSKFNNPYILSFYMGRKGCGKSTTLVKHCIQHKKKGWNVYSNVLINYPGINYFDISDLGSFPFPEHSFICLDEVGLYFDNRKFKSFKECDNRFFKYQRKRKLKVELYSQSWDIDKKVRDLCDRIFLVKCVGNVISVNRQYFKEIVVTEPQGDSGSNFEDAITKYPFFKKGCFEFTFMPSMFKYFDTKQEI